MRNSRLIKWDGHTHTEFCRHGSDAPMTAYIQRARELGFERYSITEHPPLPAEWVKNPRVMDELAMPMEGLPRYLDHAWAAKEQFADTIDVLVGLELDYLQGAQGFSEDVLGTCGDRLEDLVVSVHFLPGRDGMRCVDLSPEDFADAFLSYYGSMQAVAEEYFHHVEAAIQFAAALPVRTRIGHIQLIEKFRKALPPLDETWLRERMESLIPVLESSGVGVDVNTAGFRKTTCGKAYVPDWFVRACRSRGIECVFGSDAHHPQDVGAQWDWYAEVVGDGE